MMRRILFLLALLISSPAFAIEYEFDGGQITALGGVTTQPAGLGYLDQKYSFSAGATSLDYTKYDFKGSSLEQNTSPFNMKPVYIGSAMSTSYGGWSLLIVNTDNEIKGRSHQINSGTTMDSDFSSRTSAFSVLVSSAFRIHNNWSLGWGLGLKQIQTNITSTTSAITGGGGTLNVQNSLAQATTGFFNMGTLLSLEQFVWGVKISTPQTLLTRKGNVQTKNLAGATNSYSENDAEANITIPNDWTIESGVRFGRTGFAYVLSDLYSSLGQHVTNFGFEYVGDWGSVASGCQYSDFQGSRTTKLTVGFVKDHKNFKWGVGPYYKSESNDESVTSNTKTLGVLYSSEIRY